MTTQKQASFQLNNFKINKFSFIDIPETENTLSLNFIPTGKFIQSNATYELSFTAQVFINNPNEISIQAEMTAYFSFEEANNLDEIPTFFYRNAIAIVFPYMRSFLSSLTLQANIKHVLLPIMNLSNLEEPLKASTIVVSE
jgi:preprotein translocase subunit SecB